MKLIKSSAAVLFSTLLCTHMSAFAKQSINIKDNFAFDPVPWSLSMVTGGFSLYNQTTKKQFIQVTLHKGCVGVFTLVNGEPACNASLGGNSVSNSVICEVASGNSLYVDYDFSCLNVGDAVGTYQVEMG